MYSRLQIAIKKQQNLLKTKTHKIYYKKLTHDNLMFEYNWKPIKNINH